MGALSFATLMYSSSNCIQNRRSLVLCVPVLCLESMGPLCTGILFGVWRIHVELEFGNEVEGIVVDRAVVFEIHGGGSGEF